MDSLDVVDDDLVCRINVLLLMEVIGAVQQAASMMSKMLGHGLSQGLPVAWG